MKYVEQVKSVVLFLLIFLSLTLTFTIWNFTPSYDKIESSPAVDVSIGEKKTIKQVVRPIKMLYQEDETVKGTTKKDEIDLFTNSMEQWEIREVTRIAENASPKTLSSYMHEKNRFVLYYPGNIPFPVFDALVDITDSAIPEASFDRIAIEWATPENAQSTIYFINTISGMVYQGRIAVNETNRFQQDILEKADEYPVYVTDEKIGKLPIYVPEEKTTQVIYPYLLEEITPESFRSALFESTSNIESSGDLANKKYTDDTGAIMRLDEAQKSMSFVQPAAETSDPSIPSELIFNTVDFINDHGGWTNDYRYFGLAPLNQQVSYRLFLDNLPVFSSTASAELEVRWGMRDGQEQVFRYVRPYYVLESTAQTETTELEPGTEALAAISELEKEQLANVTEIIPGYELVQTDGKLITFLPAWYYQIDGTWKKLSQDAAGGGNLGLE
ncbi:YycH family regulatory protein [Planococcus sp. YIM B11945]|uniref:YycH family regulatory protein n=1 Tax=Planococcus sp. YIM B11945 TaxID=3435410 RepID=UPI003D7CA49F